MPTRISNHGNIDKSLLKMLKRPQPPMGWSRIWNPTPERDSAPQQVLSEGTPASPEPPEPHQQVEPEPQQQVRPREKQQTAGPGRPSRVDWGGYVRRKLYDRFDELGLPHPNDPNPKWRRQAHAEGWVERLRVPTGEGEGTDQIKNLAAESTIRDHVVQFMREYATEQGWVYDEQQKGWTRMLVEAGE
jgi:hypothetical protein